MARPKIDNEIRKDKHLSLRLTESEYIKLVEIAEKKNMTISKYIRELLNVVITIG